ERSYTRFPYTTLFRSGEEVQGDEPGEAGDDDGDDDRALYRGQRLRIDVAEELGHHPVAGHGDQDARLAVDRDQRDGEDRDHRTDVDDGVRPVGADDVVKDGRQRRRLPVELLPGLGGQGGDGDEDVDGGDDEEGGDEGPGHRLLRILRLISCRGDGVHADVAEEDQPGAGNDAGESEGGEVGE